MKNKPLTQGFTLIELATVVAVIITLALTIRPIYVSHVKRDKVTEGITLAATAKIAVSHHAADNRPLATIWTPPTATDAVQDISIYITDTTGISLSSHGELVTSLPAHQAGEIVITFSTDIAPVAHNELILSPRLADATQQASNGHELPLDLANYSLHQAIIWECNSANPPSVNRGTRGNLDANLAPVDCRA
jgi:type IV pilus assembly protein PilA